MRKFQAAVLDDRPKSRRSRIKLILLTSLFVLLSPVLYESGRLCIASWQGMFGSYPEVRTPVLDALSAGYATVSHDFRQWSHRFFSESPWKPSYVLGFAVFLTVVLSRRLHKG